MSKVEIRFNTNNKLLGHAIMDVDGFYYFYPIDSIGGWCEFGLKYVHDKLVELNKDYNELLKKDRI